MIKTNGDFQIFPLGKKTEVQRSKNIALKILFIKDKLTVEAMTKICNYEIV